MTTTDEVVRYGNLREPKMPGLGRLSFGASAFLIISAVLVMIFGLISIWLALGWALFALAAVAPAAFPRRDGYGRYQVLFRRQQTKGARRRQQHLLRQGVAGALPEDSCRLPGMAASTRLSRHFDVHGREFGLIQWPHGDLYAVVLHLTPSGFSGLDKEVCDNQVAHWAGWLAQLNTVSELVGAAVVVETVPDSGQRLHRAMDRGRLPDEELTEYERLTEEEIRETAKIGSPTLTCRMTITLSSRVGEGDEGMLRTHEEMAQQIADLLPAWTGSLAATGAGTAVRPCTTQEIVDFTRVAFDPSVAGDVEDAQLAAASGEGDGTGLRWSEAGPIYHEVLDDSYRHDTAISRSWQMKSPPRGAFFAETLQRLLEPHKDIERKRVTLLYRPETPEASAMAAEADVKKARFKATQSRRAKAIDDVELRAAEKTAEQEAMGSPLVRVGLIISISSFDEAALRRASRAVRGGLAAQARIALRLPLGSQDTAFLTGLPLGLVPQHLARVSRRPKKDAR